MNDLTKKRDYTFDLDRAKKLGMTDEEVMEETMKLAKSKFGNYDKSITANVYEIIHNVKYYNGYVINGILQGWWKEYYDNGSIRRNYYYLNGVKDIEFRYFDNGQLERVLYFSDGGIGVYKREWNPNGYFIIETIIDSSKNAIFRLYDTNRDFIDEKSEEYLRKIRDTKEREDWEKLVYELYDK